MFLLIPAGSPFHFCRGSGTTADSGRKIGGTKLTRSIIHLPPLFVKRRAKKEKKSRAVREASAWGMAICRLRPFRDRGRGNVDLVQIRVAADRRNAEWANAVMLRLAAAVATL